MEPVRHTRVVSWFADDASAKVTIAKDVRSRGHGVGPGEDEFEKSYKKLYNEANDPFADFNR